MKLSDYVAGFLAKEGVKHTFGITGGAITNILDSVYRNGSIQHICNHNEQASAMAADAYSRITGNIGVSIATSGPGATNLLTGVCCSYYDSIPTVSITGQVPTSQLKRQTGTRQIGFQETDVVAIFKPITKYAALVDDPKKIRYELEKAFYLARHGRPGPVLLDICDDVQRAEINPEELSSFLSDPEEFFPFPEKGCLEGFKDEDLERKVSEAVKILENAERPVVVLGGGVRIAKAERQAYNLIEKLQYPVALTWAAMDMLPDDYPLLVRDFGVSANRAGNFAVQNSDAILAIGTRLDTHEAGSKASTFARAAKKIVVDVDINELAKYGKFGMTGVDVLINEDVRDFFDEIGGREIKPRNVSNWTDKIKEWRTKYPICPKSNYDLEGCVDPYVFLDVLSKQSKEGDIIITDAGGNLTQTMQGFKVKKDQRLFSAFNHSPMGYSLPASIGAFYASNRPVTCIIGDGGILMNVQELATIARHNMPIKIFVFNNDGYGIIRQTQDTWLKGRHFASSIEHGLGFPDFGKLADAHDIESIVINDHSDLETNIKRVLRSRGPILCDVQINPDSKIIPKLSFGRPIEDSEPLLDREEFKANMIVPPLENK